MLHDILDDDHIQWHPPLIGHYTNFWPLLISTLLPNLTFYLIVQGFHRTYATGAACQQRTLTPPDTWSCPTLGLACVLMSRPISPELVLSPDFWISNTPRYFSFASFRVNVTHFVVCVNATLYYCMSSDDFGYYSTSFYCYLQNVYTFITQLKLEMKNSLHTFIMTLEELDILFWIIPNGLNHSRATYRDHLVWRPSFLCVLPSVW